MKSFISSNRFDIKCSEGAEEVLRPVLTRRCYICGGLYQMTAMEYAFHKFGRVIHDFSTHEGGDDDWCCPNCAEELLRIKNL